MSNLQTVFLGPTLVVVWEIYAKHCWNAGFVGVFRKTTARSDEKPICTNRAIPSESHGVSLVYGLISRDGGG